MVLIGIVILLFAVAPVPALAPPQPVAPKQVFRGINPATNLPQGVEAEAGGFLLADAWPTADELPAGWAYDFVDEGLKALGYLAPVAEGERDLRPEILADIAVVRHAMFTKSRLHLVGIEFKSTSARAKWQKELFQNVVPYEDGTEPPGLTVLEIVAIRTDRYPQAAKDAALLRPVVQKKMKEAAEKLRK
jgi:hypothetical protein